MPGRPWIGGGKASARLSDDVLSAARGFPPEERGLTFWMLDEPHLGTLCVEGVEHEKELIGKMTDVELDAWLHDRSLEPPREGLSRSERLLLAYRVRKLPCAFEKYGSEGEALEAAHEAFVASAALPAPEEDALTDEVAAACGRDERAALMLRQLNRFLTRGAPVWLTGLSKSELNGRWGVIGGRQTAEEFGPDTRYPVSLGDASGERIAVRPHNLRPGRPPAVLAAPAAAPAPAAADAASVQAALEDGLGPDVAGLVMEKALAATVEGVDAEMAKELEDDGQWKQWHEWLSRRVCHYSLEERGAEGGGGGGLCARCRVVWYASAQAQRAHWPVFKRVCRAPDLAKIGRMDAAACVAALARSLGQAAPDADVAAVLYRLGHLLKTNQAEDSGDIGYQMHGLARGVAARYASESWELLWAVPGMPQVMLNEPLLKRSLVRRGRVEAAMGREATADEEFEYDLDPWGDRGAYEYCFLHYNLLLGAGFESRQPGMCSAHDGVGAEPRDSCIGRAACARAVQLWLDPLVRQSCGDALGPAASFACAWFARQGDDARATALLSGIGEACLEEMDSSGSGAARHARALLKSLDKRLWQALAAAMYQNQPDAPPKLTMAAAAAISLAMAALRYLHEHGDGGHGGRPSDEWEVGDQQMLERIVGGCLQVGVARPGPLTDEQKWRRTVGLRTALLRLGAGRRDEGGRGGGARAAGGEEEEEGDKSEVADGSDDDDGSDEDGEAESWQQVCARDEVRFGGRSSLRALLSSTGAKRVLGVRRIEERALCSWALEQPAVLETRDAGALCAKLREFMALNVFSSKLVQAHYRKCMSDDEWQREWAGSIARFDARS